MKFLDATWHVHEHIWVDPAPKRTGGSKNPNRRPWTQDDELTLLLRSTAGHDLAAIAKDLQRPIGGCRSKLHKLKRRERNT